MKQREKCSGRGCESPQVHHKTHCLPDRKSRGKLQEKWVRIPGTGSVFYNGPAMVSTG